MLTFKHLSYDEWLKENQDVKFDEIDCENCEGTGTEECFNCGHEHYCKECEGTGKILSALEIYKQQKERDEKMLKRYLASIG